MELINSEAGGKYVDNEFKATYNSDGFLNILLDVELCSRLLQGMQVRMGC